MYNIWHGPGYIKKDIHILLGVHRIKNRNLRDCIIFAYAGSLRGSVEISLGMDS